MRTTQAPWHPVVRSLDSNDIRVKSAACDSSQPKRQLHGMWCPTAGSSQHPPASMHSMPATRFLSTSTGLASSAGQARLQEVPGNVRR